MELFNIKEAAARIGLNDQHLRKLCREKKVTHTRIGARYFLSAEQCDAIVRIVEPSPPSQSTTPRVVEAEKTEDNGDPLND